MSHVGDAASENVSLLRSRLADLKDTDDVEDFEFNKWLIACVHDVEDAERMYRKSHAYKVKMGVDQLVENYESSEVLEKYFSGGMLGVDKEGSMVRVELFGKLDIAGLLRSCTVQELEMKKLHQCELIKRHCLEQTKKLGRRVDGVTIVFDMEDTTSSALWMPGIQMYLHLVKVLEDNYPEMMKRLMVVNAPTILPILWNLGKPLISEDMSRKIFFYGDDYKERLLEHISADNLPAYFGGDLRDPDGNPRCVTMLKQGGKVPEEYSIRSDYHPFLTTTISKGSSFVIDVPVTKAFLVLNWQLKVDDKDIGVELLHVTTKGDKGMNEGGKMDGWTGKSVRGWLKGKEGGEKSVLPYERITPNHYVHDDFFQCWVPGLYRLVLDNSYSWTKQKKVNYRVWLSDNKKTK